MSVVVVADIQVKGAASLSSIKKELQKLVTETLKEKGCINYVLHQDLEDSSHFVFYEEWSSADALSLHSSSEHMKTFLKATKGQMDAKISKLSKI